MVLESDLEVYANKRWNDTGIDVAQGTEVAIVAEGAWIDGGIQVGPDGFERPWLNPVKWTRRCREAHWFELVAAAGRFDGPYYRIGRSGGFSAKRAGRLYLFANDAWLMYWNNKGALEIEVSVLAP